jgi:hypothetical protein
MSTPNPFNIGSQLRGHYDPISGLDSSLFSGMAGKEKTAAVRQAVNAKVDRDPSTRSQVQRLRNVHNAMPEGTREAGKNWYPQVHDAAQKAAVTHGRSTRAAAGVVAAVSPNMDWENSNINAFDEIGNLDHGDWDMIHRSSQGKTRHPEVAAMLKEKAPSLSRAPDGGLLKAHQIWHEGADPDAVMPVQTAPKTNHFYHNILEPHRNTGATIDGRQADLAVDAMRPWTMDRGISSAGLKRGGQTRYENYQNAVSVAAKHLSVLPQELQAMTWTHAKSVERTRPDQVKGDHRLAQSYQARIAQSGS